MTLYQETLGSPRTGLGPLHRSRKDVTEGGSALRLLILSYKGTNSPQSPCASNTSEHFTRGRGDGSQLP